MSSFSIWHWLIIFIVLAAPAWLFSKVISKAGFSGWWALLGIVPLVNIIMLYVFAFSRWPNHPER